MTQTKKKGRWGLVLIALAIIAALVAGGLYRVGQGEQALVITFGKVTGTNGPGLYWHMPGVQQIIAESVTTIRDVEYGYRTSKTASRTSNAEYTDVMEESVMLTNDNSIVQLEAIYQYTIRDVKQAVNIPVIASGGAGEYSHFYDAFAEGMADAVLAASLFHYNEIPIPELKIYLSRRGISVRM